MPTPKLTQAKIEQYAAFNCEIECLTVIASCSSFEKPKFIEELKKPGPTLGAVGVSKTGADRCVRPKINRLIRRPAGKTDIPPGSFDTSTTLADVVKAACL